MDYSKFSLLELRDGIASGKMSSEEIVRFFIKQCEDKKDLNAMIEIFYDSIDKAKEIAAKVS